jgi:hypothetical protein
MSSYEASERHTITVLAGSAAPVWCLTKQRLLDRIATRCSMQGRRRACRTCRQRIVYAYTLRRYALCACVQKRSTYSIVIIITMPSRTKKSRRMETCSEGEVQSQAQNHRIRLTLRDGRRAPASVHLIDVSAGETYSLSPAEGSGG